MLKNAIDFNSKYPYSDYYDHYFKNRISQNIKHYF